MPYLPAAESGNEGASTPAPSLSSISGPRNMTPVSWDVVSMAEQGSPSRSMPSSDVASPELNPMSQPETSTSAPGPTDDRRIGRHAQKICFVGAGFVGGPTAAVIALHNPQTQVEVVDLDPVRIAAWNSAKLPIREDGLLKVVRITRDGTRSAAVSMPDLPLVQLDARRPNLVFSTRVTEAVSESNIIFICVNTPTKTHGIGAGSMADVSAVESATRSVAKHAKEGAIIVEKSTVPCGTARMIQDILQYHRPDTTFEVLSNPEFLAEGTAVENLSFPDRILIGSARTQEGLDAAAALKRIYAAWVPDENIVTVNTFSSELSKLVANAMLAQRISSINAVSAICEEVGLGADVADVSLAVGRDTRLGSKFLGAGVGFGGSCFDKDILNLAYLARELHLDVVADFWLSILRINEYQRQRFAHSIVRELNGSLRGKKIAVLGFAFKDGTNDTRNSIAVHIIKALADEMPREIKIFDPGCAAANILEEVRKIRLSQSHLGRIKICESWRDCVRDASAICVLTQWGHFRGGAVTTDPKPVRFCRVPTERCCIEGHTEYHIMALEEKAAQHMPYSDDPFGRLKPLPLCAEDDSQMSGDPRDHTRDDSAVDWAEVADMMQEPRWVFDGRNVVDVEELKRLGFRVRGIGKG